MHIYGYPVCALRSSPNGDFEKLICPPASVFHPPSPSPPEPPLKCKLMEANFVLQMLVIACSCLFWGCVRDVWG